jgi:hypothetical protein
VAASLAALRSRFSDFVEAIAGQGWDVRIVLMQAGRARICTVRPSVRPSACVPACLPACLSVCAYTFRPVCLIRRSNCMLPYLLDHLRTTGGRGPRMRGKQGRGSHSASCHRSTASAARRSWWITRPTIDRIGLVLFGMQNRTFVPCCGFNM